MTSTARSLGDWLANTEFLRTPEIVIPSLVVEGRVSLLSGREKIGKSTLAAGAASAASRGSEVFGRPVHDRIRSLWYACDEHVSDAVRRFSTMGAAEDGIVINAAPRTADELLSAITHDLDAFPDIGVVWVDTLSRIFAGSGVDQNSSREVEPVLAQLVDYLHDQNIAGVFLYHTGKGGREYRGSTAIGATVDDVLTLRRRGHVEEDDFDDDDRDDGRRLLVQDGRNLRGRVHLTFSEGVYRLYDETHPPHERIMETLRDHGSATGRAELTKLAGVRKSAGLRAITELIAEGSVIETGRHLTLAVPKPARVPVLSLAREPTARSAGFPGSARFPEQGTTPEPAAELEFPAASLNGSQLGKEGVTETGNRFATDPRG